MRRIRVIPVLLINQGRLEKTVKFKSHKYVGDPINAVKIFNEKEVDELVVLDISASPEGKAPNIQLAREIASECFMPLGYGGGIKTVEQAERLFQAGVEKVILNTSAYDQPKLVEELAGRYGSQSIVVSIDVKKNIWGKYRVYTKGGRDKTSLTPRQYAQRMEAMGAGELILTSIDRDGTFEGYDIDLLKEVCPHVGIPVVACGGAGKINDFKEAINVGFASAVSAGSFFVFKGIHRAVLISYPSQATLKEQLYSQLGLPNQSPTQV